MGRILVYLIAWVVVVPWLAATFWLSLERLTSHPGYGAFSAIQDAAFAGVFAVAFSLRVTVPLSLALVTVVKLVPRFSATATFRSLMFLGLFLVGGLWAFWLVTDGGFKTLHLAAFMVGGIAGLALAVLSYSLLSVDEDSERKRQREET